MSNTQKDFKGNLGLFLVCAELSKRNLVALPTSRNTRGYDVVVLNPLTNKTRGLQVKCADGDFPVLSSHFKDYEAKIDEKVVADFVFVDVSDPDKPEYYIVSAKDLRSLMKRGIPQHLARYCERHKLTREQVLASELANEKKQQLWAVKVGRELTEAYKNKWETVTDRLALGREELP